MGKHFEVPEQVKALVALALPGGPRVIGLDVDEAKPTAIGPEGLIIVRSGDPGPAAIDLSPPTYNYERELPLELGAAGNGALTARQQLDAWLAAIAEALDADRTLGGLCDYLDATAPTDGETDVRGAKPIAWADASIVATYSTTSPLG